MGGMRGKRREAKNEGREVGEGYMVKGATG